MDLNDLAEKLAAAIAVDPEAEDRNVAFGVMEDQVVMVMGDQAPRAFVDPVELGGFLVEVLAVVGISGNVDEDELVDAAREMMDMEIWPEVAMRDYVIDEEDWNAELGILTRFGTKSVQTYEELVADMSFIASKHLSESYEVENDENEDEAAAEEEVAEEEAR